MSGSPVLKIFNPLGEYIGCVKHYEDAAALVANYGSGAQVRLGHNKKHTLWREGSEAISAGESFSQAALTMLERCQEIHRQEFIRAYGHEPEKAKGHA